MTNTTHIYNLDELQDRRIMMDKKLPPYGYALIILTGFLMVYLLLWSTKNYRTSSAEFHRHGAGCQQDLHHVQLLRRHHRAERLRGSYVNEGDLIAHIKSTDLDIQTESYENQLALYKKQKSQ